MSKCYASAVLAIAAAEIGYHEKKSNSQLGNPTANAGSASVIIRPRQHSAAASFVLFFMGTLLCCRPDCIFPRSGL